MRGKPWEQGGGSPEGGEDCQEEGRTPERERITSAGGGSSSAGKRQGEDTTSHKEELSFRTKRRQKPSDEEVH